MKDDYNTNSHYLTYTFLFRKVGRMYFLNLGVKGLMQSTAGNKVRCKKGHELWNDKDKQKDRDFFFACRYICWKTWIWTLIKTDSI